MIVIAKKTRPIMPPQDDLLTVLDAVLGDLHDNSIVAISSKVVAIWQGRCVAIPEGVDELAFKDELAKKEADMYLPRGEGVDHFRMHTIKDGIIIGSSGIDKSNANGYCVLWPQDSMNTAIEIRNHIMQNSAVENLGVVITDSHSTPLRNGVTGIALGYAGFMAEYDYRETEDIFGRKLHAERLNVADSVATSANLVMGEGNESTPIAILEDVPHVIFSDKESEDEFLTLKIDIGKDIFSTFFKGKNWQRYENN